MTPVEPQTDLLISPEPQPEPAPSERHLSLVARRARRRAHRRLVAYLVGAGILAVAFGLVGLHVVIAEEQFHLDKLQQEASNAQAKYEKLRLSVAQLEAPARIVSVAEGHGMQQPGSVTYVPAPKVEAKGGQRAGGRASTAGQASATAAPDVVQAPAGDADWPSVKPYLSGSP